MKQLVNVSSMPWFPAIDSSWDVVRADHFLSVKKTVVGEKWPDYTLLSLTKAGVTIRDFTDRQGKLPETFDSYQEVQIGDLVMCLFDMDETPRTVGISSHRGMITGAYTTFQFDQTIAVPRYFEYLFISIDDRKAFKAAYSGLRKTIRPPVFLSLRFPLPPLKTQQRIADYLDRETAEIDAAVGDLDRYMELLEKRRLETITSAVEGSSGPGKDKLGSEEFFKPKLGYVVLDIRTGLNPRKNFELDTPDAENWYVTVRELDGASIRTSEATSKINDQALELIQKRARIKVGDVLFSGTGTIGNTALVSLPPINWGVKEGIYILTPDVSRMRSDFLLWILRSRKILSLADEMSDGSTVKSIPIEKLKRVPIPLPSLSVQKLIVDYLDRETIEIDDLIEESTKLRDLLLKRRSVLITEVVTGRKQV